MTRYPMIGKLNYLVLAFTVLSFAYVSIPGNVLSVRSTASGDDEATFDNEMASLFQLGVNGDDAKLAEIIERCDSNISKSDLIPISNSWKGTVLVLKSSKLFQEGSWQDGLKVWNEGLGLIDEADSDDASPYVKKRVANVCLPAWTHEQDKDRAQKLARQGVIAIDALRNSNSKAWSSLSIDQKLSMLVKAVNAAKSIKDALAESFAEEMEQLSPDHELTKRAQQIIATGAMLSPAKTEARFDQLVREDFFEGIFNEDEEAFDRAMKLCQEALKKDAKNYEAMVWQGSGKLFQSGKAHDAGEPLKGEKLWADGLNQMHVACTSKPDDVSVLIPRAATLVGIGRIVPLPESDRLALLNLAVYDYERTLQIQKPYFDQLSSHAKSELLFGLADGWHQLSNQEKANGYFNQVVKFDPDGEQAELAKLFLNGSGKPELLKHRNCAGCH